MAKRAASRSRASRKRALLVGINQYPDAPLGGCVNDAIMVGHLLIDHFGFRPGGGMRLLVDHRATKAAIMKRLDWLVDGARPGDTLVFHYSGHGTQVPDRSGDEVDKVDECLVPIDHDWDDPFIDDELADIVASVSPEVNFTIILDCCHSGTGTRRFNPQMELGGPQTIKRILPPPDIRFRAVDRIEVSPGTDYFSVTMRSFQDLSVRRFGETVSQNAILIAGCRDDQLSKDAYIDSDYHGALTYSLFQALNRLGPDVSYSQWLEETSKTLKGYHIQDQDPQLECPDEMAGWRLFSTEPAATRRESRAAADRHVVYVHGICEHEEGYSNGWWDAMRRYVPSIPSGNRHEVLWSDLVTPRGRARLQPVHGQSDVTESIQEILVDRAQRQRMRAVAETVEEERSLEVAGERAFLGIPGLNCVDDFAKYLLNSTLREQVIARFNDVVRPLLESGKTVDVISHSWGTVVAYEALCLMEGVPDDSVTNFFTVGSALSIPPVKRLLLPEAIGGAKPRAVRRWINLDAKHDIVGGPLKGAPFKVDYEYLQLTPVGCSRWFASPSCAHSSYFHPENRAVNRDIFGHYIER